MPTQRLSSPFAWPFARVCAVDLGASQVTAALYGGRPRRPRLLRRVSVRFARIPDTDPDWVAAAAAALEQLSRELGFRGPAILGLAPHLVLTKQVTTPAVDPRQRDKVIQFEVSQAIPLALEDLVWDCRGDFETRPDWQLTFSVAKREVVEVLVTAASAVGLKVQGVYPSDRALAAAWDAADAGSPAVVIGIGARSTTVLVRGSRGYRERSIPVGGQLVTRGLMDGLKLPLFEAEVLLGHEDRAERPREMIDRLVEQLVAGLALEIGQFEGLLSDEGHTSGRILVTGGAAKLPGLAARLSEFLGVRVERPVVAGRETGSEPCEPSVVAGLVRLYRGEAGAGGGLLPDRLRDRLDQARQLPGKIALGLLPVAVLVPPLWHYALVKRTALGRAESLAVQTREIQERSHRISVVLPQIADLRAQYEQLRRLAEQRGRWSRILSDLQQALSEGGAVWIEELATTSPGGARPVRPMLRLRGRMLNLADPASSAETVLGDEARALLDRIRQCDGVEGVGDERFDLSEPGSLRFEATVVLASARGEREGP